MTGGTIGYHGFGTTRRLELPDGTDAVVSPSGRAALRYNPASMAIEVSVDGAAYVALSTGGGGASPWVDDGGGNVRLQNAANDVVVGAAATAAGEKMRIIGDVRVESQVQVTELTSVPGAGLDLEISSDTDNVNVSAAGATGFTVGVGGGVDALRVTTSQTTLQINPADSAALSVNDGTDDYVTADTTGRELTFGDLATPLAATTTAADDIREDTSGRFRVTNGLQTAYDVDISVGTVSTGEAANPLRELHTIPTADASAWIVQDAGTNPIIAVDTTVGVETIDMGNGTTNPDVRILGSGTFTSNAADNVFSTGPLTMTELAADPAAGANQGKTYTKDVAGRTELFYRDDTGAVVQMTSGGSPAPGGAGGANTEVQYNNAGNLDGDPAFIFDGTNVTLTNALFADGGLDRSAVGALAIAASTATSVTVGATLNPVSTTIVVPDNTSQVFRIEDVNGDGYMQIDTTNFGEFVGFGNNNTSPNYFFNGSNPAMSVGSNNSGRVEAASFGPGPLIGFSRAMFVGTETEATSITLGQSAAALTIDSSDIIVSDAQISLTEIAADPGAVANQGRVYTKDVSAATELFYQDSAGNVVQITSGGGLVAPTSFTSGDFNMPDNTAGAFQLREGTNAYLTINTTNASELIQWGETSQAIPLEYLIYIDESNGNAYRILSEGTSSPWLQFQTNGPTMIIGNNTGLSGGPTNIGLYVRSQSQAFRIVNQQKSRTMVEFDEVAEIMTWGNNVDNHTFQFAGDGPVYLGSTIGDNSYLQWRERTGDPTNVAAHGQMYCKDTSSITELFYQDDTGQVVQMTRNGGVGEPVLTSNTAGAYTITDPTTAADYFDINTTTAAEEITLGGSQNPAVTIDTTADITIGAAGAAVGFFGTSPANQTSAYTPTNVTTDRSFDANATDINELADVVGTIIADLQSFGLFA
jgi:hypothetical protein